MQSDFTATANQPQCYLPQRDDRRPITVNGVGLTYDALGRMVEQNRSGTYTQIVYDPTSTKLALMSAQTLQKAFVPLAGGSMAVYNSSGLLYYRHSDWLGSSRLASTPNRTVYSSTAYAPFGETYASSGTADPSFTGMNQDTSPYIYDFPAREYNSIHGRWPSPDPAGLAAVDLSDPQTFSRYAYVRNNPLHLVDPSGLDPCDDDGGCLDNSDPCPIEICGPDLFDPYFLDDGSGGGVPPAGFVGPTGPPIPLPGQQLPGATPSTFPTGPGVDWTSLIFGPPDPSTLIFNGYCVNGAGRLVSCSDPSAVAECGGVTPDSTSKACGQTVFPVSSPDPNLVQDIKQRNPEKPACWSGVFVDSASSALDLPWLPPGSDFGDAIKAGATAKAVSHAVSAGIRFNNQSSTIKKLLSLGEAGASWAAVLPSLYSVTKGLVDELKALRAGTCKPGH
jgi:RHS repeat-associated protein